MNNEMPKMEENKVSLPSEDKSSVTPLAPKGETETRPDYIEPEKDLSSNINVPLVPKKGIAVMATRDGFYGQQRYSSGDEFVVKSFEKLGLWMKCEDSNIEKKRVEFFKKKKAKKN